MAEHPAGGQTSQNLDSSGAGDGGSAPPPDRSSGHDGQPGRGSRSVIDRQILALAVPALGALVAEPLFVLADSAIVGHLGTAQLAGLSLASTILVTVVGLCVFLAYATTATVSRRMGAGDQAGALRTGVDGMWLAAGLGLLLAAALWAAAPWLIAVMGAGHDVAPFAVAYLRWSTPGLPGMLVVLAATGVLRGLLDTRTPLVVAAGGAVLNVGANLVLVYPAGMGIAGSGLGTALTQLTMAAVLAAVVIRGVRSAGVGLRPARAGLWASMRHGTPLLVRTLSLRAAILLTVWTATSLGATALAGHQVVNAVWGLVAFALDALAIAGQALVGRHLGAADLATTRAVLRRSLQWGVGAGLVLGLVVAATSWWLTPLFTPDPAVRSAATVGLLVAAAFMPMAGWVFVLDGVLIGAGDGVYLAWAGMLTLAVYLPCAVAVRAWAPGGAAGLAWLWAAFAGAFMLARALTTGLRARGSAWMVTGA